MTRVVSRAMVPVRGGVRLGSDVYLPGRGGIAVEGKFPRHVFRAAALQGAVEQQRANVKIIVREDGGRKSRWSSGSAGGWNRSVVWIHEIFLDPVIQGESKIQRVQNLPRGGCQDGGWRRSRAPPPLPLRSDVDGQNISRKVYCNWRPRLAFPVHCPKVELKNHESGSLASGDLSDAASIWRDLAPSAESIAFDGVEFLKRGVAYANHGTSA